MHDPKVYEDPEEFRPERFLKDGRMDPHVRDPYSFVFGFGRRYVVGAARANPPTLTSDIPICGVVSIYRICPGRHFGMNGLFINVASVLHVFNITTPVDENGEVINIEPKLTSGLLWYVIYLSRGCSRTHIL